MSEAFESWCILEQLGHRRTAGLVTEEELFGTKMGRIDIPRPDGLFTTHYFGAASLYGLTPCSEEAARAVARRAQPEPVHQWELPKPVERPEASQARPYSDSFTARFDGDDPDDDDRDDDPCA